MNTKINTDEILIQLKPFFRKNNEFTADEVFKVLLELGIREADVFKVSAPSMRKAKAQKLIAKTGARSLLRERTLPFYPNLEEFNL